MGYEDDQDGEDVLLPELGKEGLVGRTCIR
jgi:hypothetical protein